MSNYKPADNRYDVHDAWFRYSGRSGLKLPAISLGMWHNFGTDADDNNARQMCYTALDHGITHFDLANNYGPLPGSAEERTGNILKDMPRRELVISSKAGFLMWPGPYGEWGSRKYMLASLDESLKRLKLDHVDIFYHHRPDPNTPIEETMGALEHAVRTGKAIYAGISNYRPERTVEAVRAMEAIGGPKLLINQVNYSMFSRWVEDGLLDTVENHGIGVMAFCPLSQGLLTDKYFKGIPDASRAGSGKGFLKPAGVTDEAVGKAKQLNEIAKARGQSLAQMALSWVLRDKRVTSALIGASRPQQIIDNVKAVEKTQFSAAENEQIENILVG